MPCGIIYPLIGLMLGTIIPGLIVGIAARVLNAKVKRVHDFVEFQRKTIMEQLKYREAEVTSNDRDNT